MTFRITEHGGIDPLTESPRFVAKHLAAYDFALPLAKGRVLEIGCGDGYGASRLAARAQVVAIDLFEGNVRAAAGRYRAEGLEFRRMDATELDFPAGSFDLVVSFQVIEHIPEGLLPRYLGQIRRVLKPEGRACLTTLNVKKNRKPGRPYEKSPHHDKEFTPEEFGSILGRHFGGVELYGLYPTVRHALAERLKKSGLFSMKRFYAGITTRDFRWRRGRNLDGCIDLMGVCWK